MFWYETQYRHAEEARERNKREDRKLKIEIERKSGMRALYKTQIEDVSKEQRRIKRELDRMRKSRGGPTSVFNRAPQWLRPSMSFHNKKARPRRKIERDEPTFDFFKSALSAGEFEQENELMRSIMLLGCESNSKSNNVFCNNKGVKREYNDITTLSDSNSITEQPNVLGKTTDINNNNAPPSLQSSDNSQHDTNSTTDNLLSVEYLSPIRPSSPTHSSDSNINNNDFIECTDEEGDRLTQLNSDSGFNSDPHSFRSLKNRQRRKSLDISELAGLDMKSVKVNVTRRLSGTTAPSRTDLEKRRVSDGNVALSKPPSKPARRRVSEGQFPVTKQSTPSPDKQERSKAESGRKSSRDELDSEKTPQATPTPSKNVQPNQLIIRPDDREYYNADGSLRKQWTLPDSGAAWDAARGARYVRTGEKRECEVELSVQDIFKKDD